MWKQAPGLFLLLTACGAAGTVEAPPDMTELADLTAPPQPDLSAYPAGPYAGEIDAIPENFKLTGYYDPSRLTGSATLSPYGEFTFDDMRRSGKKYALLFFAGYT